MLVSAMYRRDSVRSLVLTAWAHPLNGRFVAGFAHCPSMTRRTQRFRPSKSCNELDGCTTSWFISPRVNRPSGPPGE